MVADRIPRPIRELVGPDDAQEDVTGISDRALILRAVDASLRTQFDVGKIAGEVGALTDKVDKLSRSDSNRPISVHDLDARLAREREDTNPGVIAGAVVAGVLEAQDRRERMDPITLVITTIVQSARWVSKAKAAWVLGATAGGFAAHWWGHLRHWW